MTVSFDFNFWTVLLFIMNFGLAVWVAVGNRSKAAQDELKAVHKTLAGETSALQEKVMGHLGRHSERLKALETKIEDAINDEDIAVAHRRVDILVEKVSKVEGQMTQALQSINQLLDLALKQGMKL